MVEDGSAAVAAALARAEVPHVDKVWTEMAFERVRSELVPEAPSRLTSVYAFTDPLEALSFSEMTGTAKDVRKGTVASGAVWQMVDLAAFEVVRATEHTAAAFQQSWEGALHLANTYWAPSANVETAEILVQGQIQMGDECVRLLPTLRRLGLVQG